MIAALGFASVVAFLVLTLTGCVFVLLCLRSPGAHEPSQSSMVTA